jgi:uncharacterized protein YjbJ (UPF0337 family)
MNDDQVKGKVKQVEGQIKEAVGKAVGDSTMENKGKLKNAAGKVQEAYGDLKSEIKSST